MYPCVVGEAVRLDVFWFRSPDRIFVKEPEGIVDHVLPEILLSLFLPPVMVDDLRVQHLLHGRALEDTEDTHLAVAETDVAQYGKVLQEEDAIRRRPAPDAKVPLGVSRCHVGDADPAHFNGHGASVPVRVGLGVDVHVGRCCVAVSVNEPQAIQG